jgi:hypothetical protein
MAATIPSFLVTWFAPSHNKEQAVQKMNRFLVCAGTRTID